MTDSCEDCRFFLCHQGEDIYLGICRRYPPVFNPVVYGNNWRLNGAEESEIATGFDDFTPHNHPVDTDVGAHQYPMVRKGNWCGEFQLAHGYARGAENGDPPRTIHG